MQAQSAQKQRVEALEAARHRALKAGPSDERAEQALLAALAGYEASPDADARPVVVGLSNVVWMHSRALLDALKRDEDAYRRHARLHELCQALNSLREAIDQ